MMLRLVFEVIDGFAQLGHADAEGPVLLLPAKEAVLRTHFEEPPLISCSALPIGTLEGKDSRIWTWSSTPPISTVFMPFCRAMPPRKGQSLCLSAGVISVRRSLVRHTQGG